ncbi:MAG: phosphoglycerate dehydrogenase [Gammaproteobacteria bacterium]|nr:phosphoglycerate dehydrogenase [Gammaproteobacteria bacterium]
MFKIQTLNSISALGLERMPRSQYEIASEMPNPDAILLRSFKMHGMAIPASLKAVGRAGAGVNNIPVDEMSRRGIPVFNAPGANANAVKELVLAGMLIASRNICQAWEYSRSLQGTDDEVHKKAEAGKSQFVGVELPGRTLGVVGLGAIGIKVANAALQLGMKVIGYDPQITVRNAWQLSSGVRQALSIDELMSNADYVTFHVPLVDATRHMINADRLRIMKDNVVILNFAREGIVDDQAVCAAIKAGKVYGYVSDFTSNLLKNHERVITLPHLGASTNEAEDNCAVMVADQVRDFLEHGNVVNSVNFPEVVMPRVAGASRIGIVNANVPNMVGQFSTVLAAARLNIVELLNKSRGDLAYTLLDVEGTVADDVVARIRAIEGVSNVLVFG